MKKFVFLVIGLVGLFFINGCVESSQKYKNLLATVDTLKAVNASQTAEMESLFADLNDISAGMQSIREAEHLLALETSGDVPSAKSKKQVEALKSDIRAVSEAINGYKEQVALLEKSYQLAAQYTSGENSAARETSDKAPGKADGKADIVPVGQVSVPVVSSLSQPMSDERILAGLSESRNRGFATPVGNGGTAEKNTIRICVHGDQTVLNGQSVRLRLLEPMRAGNTLLPRNTLVTGTGRIQGDRLGIGIVSLEYGGLIIPVELTVYDSDGQEGIYIPNSAEVSAAKEVAANLGQNLGTSISITNQSAGDQLLSELGKGAIQGVSQYVSKKLREEKVHLKSGYTLMLSQKKNN